MYFGSLWQAPCEAEAQCAELARAGKVRICMLISQVYAAGSEDMDTLTFGTPILLKNLTASEQKKLPVTEINLSKALEELDMPMQQFIDLCMLLGCDYLDPIKGIGPKKALKLIREHKSLDQVLEVLQSGERMKNEEVHESNILTDEPTGEAPKKRGGIQVPEFWPYQEARVLFRDPQVQDGNTVQVRIATHAAYASSSGITPRRTNSCNSSVPTKGSGELSMLLTS